jgi:hypothetical protein
MSDANVKTLMSPRKSAFPHVSEPHFLLSLLFDLIILDKEMQSPCKHIMGEFNMNCNTLGLSISYFAVLSLSSVVFFCKWVLGI